MKNTFKQLSILALSALFFVACGNSDNTTASPSVAACAVNQVQTAQGCLYTNPQMCGQTAGWNGSSCVPATTAPGLVGSTDATQYWNQYHQCSGQNMIQGYNTCTCVNGTTFSVQYDACIQQQYGVGTGGGYNNGYGGGGYIGGGGYVTINGVPCYNGVGYTMYGQPYCR
jgi:hypothetical protein